MVTSKKTTKKKTKKKATTTERPRTEGLATRNLAALQTNIDQTLAARAEGKNLREGSLTDRMTARRKLNKELSDTLNDNLRRRARDAEKQKTDNDRSTGQGTVREVAASTDVGEDTDPLDTGTGDSTDAPESDGSVDPFE